ncbi:MAG: hypothetical protein AABW61_01295 [Candidatus Aenigmatarchaeota archaeon]
MAVEKKQYHYNPFQRLSANILLGRPNPSLITSEEYQAALPTMRHLYNQVWRWHGTGRYRYVEGEVVDLFGYILKNKAVLPQRDILDHTRGEMFSVSTSLSRLYASLYAQIFFEKGKNLRNRFQTGVDWLYYLVAIAWSATINDRKLLNKQFRESFLGADKTAYFHAKYTKQPIRNKDLFEGGLSDIEGNYPMLIGLGKGAFQEAEIAKVLQRHESRSETPISLWNFTHIEVPEENVPEIKRLLEEDGVNNIPVIPIEWGEEFSKSLPIIHLLNGVK